MEQLRRYIWPSKSHGAGGDADCRSLTGTGRKPVRGKRGRSQEGGVRRPTRVRYLRGNKVSSETSSRSSRWVPKSPGRLHFHEPSCPAELARPAARDSMLHKVCTVQASANWTRLKDNPEGKSRQSSGKKDLLYCSSHQVERDPPAVSRLRIDFARLG